jgi:hypothetical protein
MKKHANVHSLVCLMGNGDAIVVMKGLAKEK